MRIGEVRHLSTAPSLLPVWSLLRTPTTPLLSPPALPLNYPYCPRERGASELAALFRLSRIVYESPPPAPELSNC